MTFSWYMRCGISFAQAATPGTTAAGLPGEGQLEPFLRESQIETQQVFKGDRFPNVVVATDGTVLAFWNGVKVRRSEDGGKTWGPEILVGKGFMGGGVIVDENRGDILAFVETKHTPQASLTVYRSTDHGKTWRAQETVIHPNKDGNVPTMHMNEHGIMLRHGEHKGRLLRPTRWYAGSNDPSSYPKHYTDAIYSDDGGMTWRTSDPFPANGTGEATVAELSDGRIYYNARRHWDPKGDLRCRWIAWSDDGGATWKDGTSCRILPDGDQCRDYGLMGGLVRLPVEGRDILIFSNIESPTGRHHGTIWASFDGGKTWPMKRLVDAGPFAYSSLDAGRPGTPSEGWIYLLFEGGAKGGGTVARFNLSWVLGGEKTGNGEVPPWLAVAPGTTHAAGTAQTERTRFLLLDSRIIESTDNVKLTLGTVMKHPANPLCGEDKPWEKRFDNLYANVFYNAADGLYKCWYSPFIVDHSSKGLSIEQRRGTPYRPPRNREMGVCYAVSRDGLKWEKPALNLVDFEGRKANNLVVRGPHGAGVFKDPHDPDPQRRYKMFHARDALRFSADGLHWSDPVPCAGVGSNGDTHNHLLWAPELGCYVGFVRLRDNGQRMIGRTESADLKQWTRAVEVLRGNAADQAYAMPVFRYADIYLGMVAVFRTREDRVHVELAWSPDSITWHRIQPGTPLIANSPKEGDYDWGCVYAAASPVVLDNEIRIYYGASNGKHTGWRDGFLGLATLRPDGWAGFEPLDRDKPAVVTIRAIRPDGRPIRITADVAAGGSVKVSLLDQNGKQIVAAESVIKTVTDSALLWSGQPGGGDIRLRCEIRSAKLYSISFGPKAVSPGRNSTAVGVPPDMDGWAIGPFVKHPAPVLRPTRASVFKCPIKN